MNLFFFSFLFCSRLTYSAPISGVFIVFAVFFCCTCLFKNWAKPFLSCHMSDWSFISDPFDPEKGENRIYFPPLKRAERPRLKTIRLLCASYRPALLLPCFCSACLDSFIQGNIFLFIGALCFCSLDLWGNVSSNVSACASCWCAAA